MEPKTGETFGSFAFLSIFANKINQININIERYFQIT